MDMVEKVARVLAAEMGTIWGGPLGENDPSFLPYKARYMSVTRAAIEAMREPTPQMKMVNQGVFMNAAKGYTIEGSDWHKIIDAALSPSGEKWMEEPWYVKVDREAVERVQEELAKPLANPMDPQDDDKEFNPWALFPALYGSYSGAFDQCAIQVLEDLRDRTFKRHDLAGEMFREMLCTAHLCDYGTSPRVCFPTSGFEKLLPDLIEKWKAYYLNHWQTAYEPETGTNPHQ